MQFYDMLGKGVGSWLTVMALGGSCRLKNVQIEQMHRDYITVSSSGSGSRHVVEWNSLLTVVRIMLQVVLVGVGFRRGRCTGRRHGAMLLWKRAQGWFHVCVVPCGVGDMRTAPARAFALRGALLVHAGGRRRTVVIAIVVPHALLRCSCCIAVRTGGLIVLTLRHLLVQSVVMTRLGGHGTQHGTSSPRVTEVSSCRVVRVVLRLQSLALTSESPRSPPKRSFLKHEFRGRIDCPIMSFARTPESFRQFYETLV